MDGGAWWAAVHGVARNRTRLSDFTFTFHFHALEKEMATHSSVLAWRIPVMGEPGGLLSMGSHRVRHDWSDLAAAAAVRPLSSHEEEKKFRRFKWFPQSYSGWVVKNSPTMQETQVWSLGQEDALEKEMETHSSILAQRIPRTEDPGEL